MRTRKQTTIGTAPLQRVECDPSDCPALFRAFCDRLEQAVWVVNASDQRIAYVNSAFEHIWGRSCQDLHDSPAGWLEFVHPEDRRRVQAGHPQGPASQACFIQDYRIVRPDGAIRWISARRFPLAEPDGAVRRFGVIAEDVTERRITEDAARTAHSHMADEVRQRTDEQQATVELLREEMQERVSAEAFLDKRTRELQAVFRALPDLYFRLSRDGTILSHLATDERELYLPPSQFLGKRMQEVLPAHVGKRFEELLAQADSADGVQTLEYPLEVPTGLQWYEARMVADGQEGWILVVRNVSQRKQAEEERFELKRQVEHSQKLESLGLLASGIAHDFNNLLMGVCGHAELALLQLAAPSPLQDSVRQIREAGIRCAELCQQLLEYAGKSVPEIQPLVLGQLVAEMQELLQMSVPKSVSLECHLPASSNTVRGDPRQLRQVLLNLVMNAADAAQNRGGTVRISTGTLLANRSLLAAAVLGQSLAAGPYAYLEVADDGLGMDADTLAKMFDPFFTTKAEGRGLGLATVLGIVRSHQGAIKVASQPQRGTTVRVLLPCGGELEEPLRQRERPAASWRGTGTILVVDDEVLARTLPQRILEELGFSVLLAVDGREAVEVFRKQADQIRAVVLDIYMPRLGGEATAAELRRIRADVRIVLTSGCAASELRGLAGTLQVAGYLPKPYSPAVFTAKLREILGD